MNPAMEIAEHEMDQMTTYARYQLWYQYAGPRMVRKCLYPWCDRQMTFDDFYVIHYDKITMWNVSSIENMRPVCEVCYLNMRQPTMREWVDQMDDEARTMARDDMERPSTPRNVHFTPNAIPLSQSTYHSFIPEESECDTMEL